MKLNFYLNLNSYSFFNIKKKQGNFFGKINIDFFQDMKNNSFSYLFILYQLFKMILRVDSNVNFEIRIQICSTPNSNSNTILNVSTIRYANTEIPYNYLENHPRNQIRIQTILKSIDKFAR